MRNVSTMTSEPAMDRVMAGAGFRVSCLLLLAVTYAHQPSLCAERPVLMPWPESVTTTDDKFRFAEDFSITVEGKADQRLYDGATRALRRLAGRTGIFFTQDFVRPDSRGEDAAMLIRVDRPGKVIFGEDESYSLTVTGSGIQLSAITDIGALRGLETFLQLLAADEDGYYCMGAKIVDHPRFPWRGLMIDASRHFMPIDVIRRNLDAMAAVKLNVFHWHLSDDQGFRVESKTFPLLHERGSDGLYYTQTEIRELIRYADERGIRVVPEFDVPGHATAWLVAYPELASGTLPPEIERGWGIFYPVMNPVKEFTYTFLDTLFGEMAQLFPDDFFHIGGDEIEHEGHEAEDWNNSPEIQKFKSEHQITDNKALQAYFNERLLTILTKYDKIMLGWDEILHERMPANVVIQSWRGRESMEHAARGGYRSILSNGYYIDLIQPTEFHYLNDPIPEDSPLSDSQKSLILGGESTMWSEFVSPETIDSRIWPRQVAIAERLWSPQSVRDLDDMFRRMDQTSLQLEELGLTHEKNYDMMLRRITRSRDVDALKTFVDVVEPVKQYNRGRQKPHTSLSPLTRVVDIARPDARVARNFRRTVDRYISDGSGAGEIVHWLRTWEGNHARFAPLVATSPMLKEVAPLSAVLAQLSTFGLEALDHLEKGETKPNLQAASKDVIEKAREPNGQVELAVVSAIEKLVMAASQQNSTR